MKRLIIKRKKEWFNRNCRYQVFVDGKEMLSLTPGEEHALDIPHNALIRAEMNKVGSNTFQIQNDETEEIRLLLSANERLHRQLVGISVMLLPVMLISNLFSNIFIAKVVGTTICVAILFLVLYLFFGRNNNWLFIEKI